MSETTTVEQPQVSAQGRQEITIGHEQLAGNMFGIDMPKQEPPEQQQTQQTQEAAKTEPTTQQDTQTEEEVIDENEFYTREFGKTKDDFKKEYDELVKFKTEKPQEQTWANEDSKKVHELLREGKIDDVIEIYNKQKAIEKVISSEVNKDSAADIIKLNMQLKYPTLTKEQIDFQYRQEYGIPKEPIFNDLKETEDEFKERHDSWKEQVSNIEMKATIAATMAKPEIEQAKTKIVFPDISNQQAQQKPLTQEELDAAKKYEADFIQAVDNSLKNFNGFNVSVKHEGVDLPITYGVAEEEKTSLSQRLKDFAKSNYDANALFAPRWVKQDGTLNAEQMAKDLSLLDNAEKAFQKIASDSSAKTLEAYLKGKKNINVSETFQQGTAQINKEDKTELDTIRDSFFG